MEGKRPVDIHLTLYLALFLWYSLIFFPVPRLLVPGTVNVVSLSSLLELFLVIILAGYLLHLKITEYFSLAVLGLWGYLQYEAHWKYLIVPPPPRVLSRYYSYFHGTLRFFPPSPTRLVPDAYHTVLGVLILANLIAVLSAIVERLRNCSHARSSSA